MNAESLNATQLAGVTVFGLAALACLRAAARRGPWIWLALLHLVFAAEVIVGLRHRLHDAADALLQGRGWYGARAGLQEGLIACVLAAGLIGCVLIVRTWRRDAPVAGAWLGSGCTAALFLIEGISLHRTDVLMYTPLGPVLAIGWAWGVTALVVAASASRAAAR